MAAFVQSNAVQTDAFQVTAQVAGGAFQSDFVQADAFQTAVAAAAGAFQTDFVQSNAFAVGEAPPAAVNNLAAILPLPEFSSAGANTMGVVLPNMSFVSDYQAHLAATLPLPTVSAGGLHTFGATKKLATTVGVNDYLVQNIRQTSKLTNDTVVSGAQYSFGGVVNFTRTKVSLAGIESDETFALTPADLGAVDTISSSCPTATWGAGGTHAVVLWIGQTANYKLSVLEVPPAGGAAPTVVGTAVDLDYGTVISGARFITLSPTKALLFTKHADDTTRARAVSFDGTTLSFGTSTLVPENWSDIYTDVNVVSEGEVHFPKYSDDLLAVHVTQMLIGGVNGLEVTAVKTNDAGAFTSLTAQSAFNMGGINYILGVNANAFALVSYTIIAGVLTITPIATTPTETVYVGFPKLHTVVSEKDVYVASSGTNSSLLLRRLTFPVNSAPTFGLPTAVDDPTQQGAVYVENGSLISLRSGVVAVPYSEDIGGTRYDYTAAFIASDYSRLEPTLTTLSMTSSLANYNSMSCVLPLPIANFVPFNNMYAACTLPKMSFESYGANVCAITLPTLSAEFTGTSGFYGSFAATFPRPTFSSVGTVTIVGSIRAVFPRMRTTFEAVSSNSGDMSVRMPHSRFASNALLGASGWSKCTLPKMLFTGSAGIGVFGAMQCSLPKLDTRQNIRRAAWY